MGKGPPSPVGPSMNNDVTGLWPDRFALAAVVAPFHLQLEDPAEPILVRGPTLPGIDAVVVGADVADLAAIRVVPSGCRIRVGDRFADLVAHSRRCRIDRVLLA